MTRSTTAPIIEYPPLAERLPIVPRAYDFLSSTSAVPRPYTFYVAASWEERAWARDLADRIREAGFSVSSRWLTDAHSLEHGYTEELSADQMQAERTRFGLEDLEDIDRSHELVCKTEPRNASPYSGGGRHVEFGYALAGYMRRRFPALSVIGHYENVFHYIPGVSYYDDPDAFVAHIEASRPRLTYAT